MKNKLHFVNREDKVFYATLTQDVNRFLKENGWSNYGELRVIGKALVMLSMYFLPLALMFVFDLPAWLMIVMAVIMGVGTAGIGMSVMHDALHGTFSKKTWVNNLFGGTIYMLGGNKINWQIQHNVYHHTYPNVHSLDEDVSTKGWLIRLSPEAKLRNVHKYQYLYAFFLYPFMTLSFIIKDFRQLFRYVKNGDMQRMKINPIRAFVALILVRLIYVTVMIVLPAIVIGLTWWQALIGVMIIHGVTGLILSIIFQLAHVVEEADQPEFDEDGNIANSWAIHQLKTTSNFAPRNRLLSWYCGGLNYQIEHHLFPRIISTHP